MTFNYGAMRNLASSLFSNFGGKFVLKKSDGKPTFDETTKKNVQEYKEYTGKCVMKTYSAEAIGEHGNLINAGDVSFVCTMDDISIIPTETKDKIVFGGSEYNVLHVATSNPSGSKIVVHTLHARKAS